MRRLIINADDLGVNPQRSHGIFQCFEFGIVSSATILANAADSAAAARRARERGFPIGLHLNLTEEYPLCKPGEVPSLLGTNGMFHGRDRFPAVLQDGGIAEEDLEREIRAQVAWIFDAYGAPTHVDSHHNTHILPAIAAVLIPVLERYGIRFVRISEEEPLPPYGYEVPEERLEEVRRVNALARAARELYASSGIGSTDHFRGLTLSSRASRKNLLHILSRLPQGTTELMVHPGSLIAYGTTFDLDPQRQTELRMLTDPSIPELLAEKKITLCSYADL